MGYSTGFVVRRIIVNFVVCNMKRVLIITYYWPPTGGSGVQRWVKFAKYLPQYGWQPVIFTPSNPEQLAVDESLLKEIPQEAEVIRTPIHEPYNFYRKLTRKKAGTQVNPINSQKKSVKQKIAIWLRGNLFVPDPRISWVKPSVKYLVEYLKKHPVDIMVTTGPPQSMHLIGRGVKKATGLNWLADFRDPWTEMFYFKHLGLWPLAKRKHFRLESAVLAEADATISVTPRVQKDFQAKTDKPVLLVTNGFDESDFAAQENTTENGFTIVHTGLFAADGNPLNLWDVLSKMCSQDAAFAKALKIRLIGKTDTEIIRAIVSRGLADNLSAEGYLPHDSTVLAQRSADILILPLRREPEYSKVYPGKIFEYLAARRPVLGIGQEDGAAADLLKECEAGEMFGWDRTDEIEQFINLEWLRRCNGESRTLNSNIDRYSRRMLTEELTGIFERVAEEMRTRVNDDRQANDAGDDTGDDTAERCRRMIQMNDTDEQY